MQLVVKGGRQLLHIVLPYQLQKVHVHPVPVRIAKGLPDAERDHQLDRSHLHRPVAALHKLLGLLLKAGRQHLLQAL